MMVFSVVDRADRAAARGDRVAVDRHAPGRGEERHRGGHRCPGCRPSRPPACPSAQGPCPDRLTDVVAPAVRVRVPNGSWASEKNPNFGLFPVRGDSPATSSQMAWSRRRPFPDTPTGEARLEHSRSATGNRESSPLSLDVRVANSLIAGLALGFHRPRSCDRTDTRVKRSARQGPVELRSADPASAAQAV